MVRVVLWVFFFRDRGEGGTVGMWGHWSGSLAAFPSGAVCDFCPGTEPKGPARKQRLIRRMRRNLLWWCVVNRRGGAHVNNAALPGRPTWSFSTTEADYWEGFRSVDQRREHTVIGPLDSRRHRQHVIRSVYINNYGHTMVKKNSLHSLFSNKYLTLIFSWNTARVTSTSVAAECHNRWHVLVFNKPHW